MFNFKILHEYRNNAKTYNVQRAAAEMLASLGASQITAKGKIPIHGPLLIIANHISVLDSLILMSQIE